MSNDNHKRVSGRFVVQAIVSTVEAGKVEELLSFVDENDIKIFFKSTQSEELLAFFRGDGDLSAIVPSAEGMAAPICG